MIDLTFSPTPLSPPGASPLAPDGLAAPAAGGDFATALSSLLNAPAVLAPSPTAPSVRQGIAVAGKATPVLPELAVPVAGFADEADRTAGDDRQDASAGNDPGDDLPEPAGDAALAWLVPPALPPVVAAPDRRMIGAPVGPDSAMGTIAAATSRPARAGSSVPPPSAIAPEGVETASTAVPPPAEPIRPRSDAPTPDLKAAIASPPRGADRRAPFLATPTETSGVPSAPVAPLVTGNSNNARSPRLVLTRATGSGVKETPQTTTTAASVPESAGRISAPSSTFAMPVASPFRAQPSAVATLAASVVPVVRTDAGAGTTLEEVVTTPTVPPVGIAEAPPVVPVVRPAFVSDDLRATIVSRVLSPTIPASPPISPSIVATPAIPGTQRNAASTLIAPAPTISVAGTAIAEPVPPGPPPSVTTPAVTAGSSALQSVSQSPAEPFTASLKPGRADVTAATATAPTDRIALAPVAPAALRAAARTIVVPLAEARVRRNDEPAPIAGTAPQPLAPTFALAPADESLQPGIDLTRDPGLHRMIDRIEILRDAADARDTRIRLVPDALGPVEVAVTRDGDAVRVHFTAAEAATRTLIAEAQPRLSELAEARGVRIERASVDAGQQPGAGGNPGQPRPQTAPPPQPRAPVHARAAADPIDDRIA